MKTKTLIEKQTNRKTNLNLVATIKLTKKNDAWLNVAGMISGPKRKRLDVNLDKINDESNDGEIIVVPGKVLSQGEVDKNLKVVALSFSEKAREKLLKAKCEVSTIAEEVKKNPSAKGVKILRR